MTIESIQTELQRKRTRLNLYLAREEKMLTDGVQSYGIGSRNLTRYNTDLAQVRQAIAKLEDEIKELEGKLTGNKPRRALGVIPRDL